MNRQVIMISYGLLFLFLVSSWLWGTPFLSRLVKFYSHGGDRLLAHLAAYDIQLQGREGLTNLTVPKLGDHYLETWCWSPEGEWGDFYLSWDPSWIEERKRFLLTKLEARNLQPDLFVVTTVVDKRNSPIVYRDYFMIGDMWALEWHLLEEEGCVRPERLEELLKGLAAEERRLPYRWRVNYYRNMALRDWAWLAAYSKHHFGLPYAFYIIPKTAILWLWLHLYAAFPGPALQMVLPFWHVGFLLALTGMVFALKRKLKF